MAARVTRPALRMESGVRVLLPAVVARGDGGRGPLMLQALLTLRRFLLALLRAQAGRGTSDGVGGPRPVGAGGWGAGGRGGGRGAAALHAAWRVIGDGRGRRRRRGTGVGGDGARRSAFVAARAPPMERGRSKG